MTTLLVRSFWHLLMPSIFKNDSVRPQNVFWQWNSLGILGCNVSHPPTLLLLLPLHLSLPLPLLLLPMIKICFKLKITVFPLSSLVGHSFRRELGGLLLRFEQSLFLGYE